MSKKTPRLFYWEDAEDAWCPVPDRIDEIITVEGFMDDGEEVEIRFKCVFMTDEEFAAIPEA